MKQAVKMTRSLYTLILRGCEPPYSAFDCDPPYDFFLYIMMFMPALA